MSKNVWRRELINPVQSIRPSCLLRARKILFGFTSRTRLAALRSGVGATVEHLGVLRRTRPRTVVDVGANRGQFLIACQAVVPEAEVFALEPLPDAARLLRRFGANERTHVYECAAGTQSTRGSLVVTSAQDCSSLLAPTNESITLFPGSRASRTIEVDVKRLDDLLSDQELTAPVLVKIDVQGTELDVLRGAVQLLARTTYVYVELSFRELYESQALASRVIAHLDSASFDFVDVQNVIRGRGGQAVQADFLFARRCNHVAPSEDPSWG